MTNIIATAILTGYCACSACTAPYDDGITASGVKPIEGTTVACNWLPFGTKLKIQGFNVRKTVQDRMAKRYSYPHIDLYFQRHADAKKFGRRVLRVQIIHRPKKR